MGKDKEYWKVDISSEDEKDIDIELISELNDQYPEVEQVEAEQEEKGRNNKGTKIIALVTITVFCFLLINSWLQIFNLPSLSLLIKSSELSADPIVKNLKNAVVKIDTLESMGTGFNIAPDGLIITNYHVVKDAKTLHVIFSSEISYQGTQLLIMPEIDLAILEVAGKDLPVLELASETNIDIGEDVLIIGNALGFFKIVEKGELLGKITIKGIDGQVLMIKGPIHKGSSGSPVFNKEGKVVAVIFATLLQDNSKDEIIGLAIPIQNIAEQIEKVMMKED